MTKFCPKCGSEIPEGSSACSSCGTPVNEQQFAQPQQTGSATPALDTIKRKFIKVFIAAAAVMLIAEFIVLVASPAVESSLDDMYEYESRYDNYTFLEPDADTLEDYRSEYESGARALAAVSLVSYAALGVGAVCAVCWIGCNVLIAYRKDASTGPQMRN